MATVTMTSPVLQICRLGQSLFKNIPNKLDLVPSETNLDEILNKLTDTFCQTTLRDFHLTPRDLMSPAKSSKVSAPVSYVNIFENDTFSLTLFGLRHKNSIIPLHDHPGMTAFMRCIHGSVSVKSYSLYQNDSCSIPAEVRRKIPRRYHDQIGIDIDTGVDNYVETLLIVITYGFFI